MICVHYIFQIIKKYDLSETSDAEAKAKNKEVITRIAKAVSGGLIDISQLSTESYLDECYTAESLKKNIDEVLCRTLIGKKRLLIIIDKLCCLSN